MVTSPDRGYDNFQECPTSNATLKTVALFNSNDSDTAIMGMNALGAIESQFECAKFCTNPSVYYTFSNVTK